jgi:hypothetical protein
MVAIIRRNKPRPNIADGSDVSGCDLYNVSVRAATPRLSTATHCLRDISFTRLETETVVSVISDKWSKCN